MLGGTTVCTASKAFCHPPVKICKQRVCYGVECIEYLLLVFVFPVEGTLLLALLTGNRGTVLLLRVGAALALVADEGCYDVAVLAGRRLAVLLDIVLALLANGARVPFTVNR